MLIIPRSVIFFISCHVLISIGGMMIHLNLHSPGKSLYFLWASPVSLFSLVVITFLYCRPSTVAWGFLLNAGTIIIGTTGMCYYSLLTFDGPLTPYRVIAESTLPAVLILWTKLPISLYILRKMRPLKLSGSDEV